MDIFATVELDNAKIQKLDLFFSGGRQKRGMNIKGIAKKTIEALYNHGMTTITSILQASEQDIAKALGKKEEEGDDISRNARAPRKKGKKHTLKSKKAANIREAIDEKFSEPVDLALLMGATQLFPHARGRTVQKIVDKYPDILTKPPKKLEKVKGVGQDTLDGFLGALPKFKKFLKDNPQIKVYVTTSQPSPTGILTGKSFVFTGKMEAGTREEAQNLVRQLGGETPGTLTKKVSFLVVGNLGGGGKKLTKADNYGVKIITESDFLKMIK
jgi:NAD-dependent DNA ligase